MKYHKANNRNYLKISLLAIKISVTGLPDEHLDNVSILSFSSRWVSRNSVLCQHSNLSTFQPSNLPTFQPSNLQNVQTSNLPTPRYEKQLYLASLLSDWVLPLLGVSFIVIYFASGMVNFNWPSMDPGTHLDVCIWTNQNSTYCKKYSTI